MGGIEIFDLIVIVICFEGGQGVSKLQTAPLRQKSMCFLDMYILSKGVYHDPLL